jgi:hypothetical protein
MAAAGIASMDEVHAELLLPAGALLHSPKREDDQAKDRMHP